jgi:phosphoribosyl 1,2-cyclic phosphodiesterase
MAGERRCPETGLAVPECSCKRCLETMLREFSPDLIEGEIKITRSLPRRRPDQGDRSEAA